MPMVSVSVSPSTIAEGGNAYFVVSRSVVSSQPLTVFYTLGGNAQLGVDYTLSTSAGQVVIPANQPSTTVVLHVMADAATEKREKIKFNLTNVAGYMLPKRVHRGATLTLPRH